MRLATATSGTIDMPRLDSTAVLSASIVPRYMGALGSGICPDSQRMPVRAPRRACSRSAAIAAPRSRA